MSKLRLKKGKNGNFSAFATAEEADAFIEKKLEGYGDVIEIDGGYAIQERKAPAQTMKYFDVEVQAAASATDLMQIPLGVNGIKYYVRRGESIILPESHIEVAKHSERIQYVMEGSKLKRVGKISTCPIMVGKERTYKEFQELLAAGNLQRDRDIDIMNKQASSL